MEIHGPWRSETKTSDYIDNNDLRPLVGRWGSTVNAQISNPYVLTILPPIEKKES